MSEEIYNLNELYGLFLDTDAGDFENLPNEYFVQQYKEFDRRINLIFHEWFSSPLNKITDYNIILNSFEPQNPLEKKIKYSIACIIHSSSRIFESSQRLFESGRIDYHKAERKLLKEIAFEAAIFINQMAKETSRAGYKCDAYKKQFITAMNALHASEYYLRNFFGDGQILLHESESTSVFLLRQSIELWAKEIMNISYVQNDIGEIVRVKPDYILKSLEKVVQNKNKYNLRFDIINLIHKWTQQTVHAGWTRRLWQVEQAQYILVMMINRKAQLSDDEVKAVETEIKNKFYRSMKIEFIKA